MTFRQKTNLQLQYTQCHRLDSTEELIHVLPIRWILSIARHHKYHSITQDTFSNCDPGSIFSFWSGAPWWVYGVYVINSVPVSVEGRKSYTKFLPKYQTSTVLEYWLGSSVSILTVVSTFNGPGTQVFLILKIKIKSFRYLGITYSSFKYRTYNPENMHFHPNTVNYIQDGKIDQKLKLSRRTHKSTLTNPLCIFFSPQPLWSECWALNF